MSPLGKPTQATAEARWHRPGPQWGPLFRELIAGIALVHSGDH